jgi:hypothetical protein
MSTKTSFPIEANFKNYHKFKVALCAKASALAIDVWPADGFLITGHAYSDADNLIERPDPEGDNALPRLELAPPNMYPANASRGTIQQYTKDHAEYISFMTAMRSIKDFIVESLPEEFRHANARRESFNHVTNVQLLNLLQSEYVTHADKLRELFKQDLRRPFTSFETYATELTAFVATHRQLQELGDPLADFSLRKQLKECTSGIPTIVAAIVGYDTTTKTHLRSFDGMTSHIKDYGAGYIIPVSATYAGGVSVSADKERIAMLESKILLMEKRLEQVPSAIPNNHTRKPSSKNAMNYCFVHGPGVAHSSDTCTKMVELKDGVTRCINGFGPEHLSCKTPGVLIGGRLSASRRNF